MINLTRTERDQIATILKRRANEIATFKGNLKDIASVDYALELEIERLRRLASRVNPEEEEEEAK
jgi:regulator of replication initiation timing